MATSKIGTWTLDLDPEKPGARTIWTLKNLVPEMQMEHSRMQKNDQKTTQHNSIITGDQLRRDFEQAL